MKAPQSVAHDTTHQNEKDKSVPLRITATPSRPRRVHCLALVAAFTLAFAPQLARGAKEVPFRAAFITEFESVVEFPTAHISVIGEGQALHMGATTAVTTNQEVNLITREAMATYTLTAANGDNVVLEFEFLVTFLTATMLSFEGSYTVAGGTGRFEGATGSGLLSGSATFTGESNGIGSFTVAGTISSTGSLK
jgi:hypothetical protein